MPTLSESELLAAVREHDFACLDGRKPGPVERVGRSSEPQRLELQFGWAIGGLENDLEREIAALVPQKFAEIALSWQVAGPAAPPLSVQPGVRNLLAVASAKGGVGKSTVAVNLALALARRGARVGLLDADIQGPNVPLLLGLDPGSGIRTSGEGDKRQMIPAEVAGLRVLSMGVLATENKAVIWRGPMVSGALRQLMLRTEWGELDYLLIDMPPGTGDISLTLAQSVPLGAALIVSTADPMARMDSERGAEMFRKLRVPLLGLIENMSYWQCPDCSARHELFGRPDATRDGADDLPLLGSVPLLPPLADGRAQLLADPQAPAAEHWQRAADAVAIALAEQNERKSLQRPRILDRVK